MGISSSSLLDDSKSNSIRGQADAQLKDFSVHYKHQYLVAFFSKVQDEVEQQKAGQMQLLKQREPPKPAEVLYEENVLYFDETRKWRERFMVVRANYSLECHDSYETFMKGVPPRSKLLPTGGTVLTSEDKYMVLVDKCFPDLNNVKEEFAPPMATMPGQFPVYLRLPFRRDSYFCFRQEARQIQFISILTDCIRHQNQDFLKKTACEVQAFLKAIRFYRQQKGLYESWDMLIGSDVRVLSNMLMEELLPSLQTEMLPRLKGRKTDRKKAWFATMEAVYILIQEQNLKGLSALKEECREMARQQEARIRSDMDQIIASRAFLEGKLRASVTEPAVKFCSEHVQPYLASILEELMGPISAGFQEVRVLCERQMDQLCRDFPESRSNEEQKLALEQLRKSSLQGCYQHVDVLQDQLQELHSRYNFSNCSGLVHSTQIDMQQLMENALFTFEMLLRTALKDNPAKPGSALEKAKHRVLKQYDYDSSTVRKRIFQQALLDITLPVVKKNLAPTFKTELQAYDEYIFADSSNFIQVENVYEDILLQTLESEVRKVVKEAASLKKHNLFMDGTDMRLISQSSLSECRTPTGSTPSSPARSSQSQSLDSPVLGNGKPESPTSSVTEAEMMKKAESPITAKTVREETQSTPEAEKDIPQLIPQLTIAEEQKEPTDSAPEAERDSTPNTAEENEDITLSTAEEEKDITQSTVEAEKQITLSTPETEAVNMPSALEAERESFTAETEDNTINIADNVKENTAITEETEESKPSAPNTEGIQNVLEVEEEETSVTVETHKEDTPSAAETEEDTTKVAETQEEDTPIAAAATEEDMSCALEVAQEDLPSVAEVQTETAVSPTEPQSDAPSPSPNTDSAGEEVPSEDSMAEAGRESSPVPADDEVEEIEDSDDVTVPEPSPADSDGRAASTGDSSSVEIEISTDPAEEVEDNGAMSAEEGGAASSCTDPTEDVTESDVSLTSDPMAEDTEGNTEAVSIDPAPEVTDTEECGDTVSTAEITEGGVATLRDEPTPEPTESPLSTAAVAPRVNSPAVVTPPEEPEQEMAQAPDCIKEIRDLVVEIIEVEEMVQHYPDSNSA
ncbi:hypothetical protein AGOR_G00144270 [Albula goreensis]|uniref:Niban 1/2/3 domain-containing protein n=1 Tax=Albula goreensis TaxID=1534307 RepID=A0A8T3D662_9TELE|nr:hypothetical protein AGOR_G00144270 [Albula goreensis]